MANIKSKIRFGS